MARDIFSQKRFQGIADYLKESPIQDAFFFGRFIDYRNDPQSITLLPKSVKESGSTVIDLLKWGDIVPTLSTSYFYGDTGYFYSRSSAGVWSNIAQLPTSHGNGEAYFQGDDYVYLTTDDSISRYGPTNGTPTLTNQFLKSLRLSSL